MKIKTIHISVFISLLFIFSSCRLFESSYPPKYNVQNVCDFVVDFKVTTAGNQTVRYDSVQNNTSTEPVRIKEGTVSVSVFVYDGKSSTFNDSFNAKNNKSYTITMHDGSVFGTHIISLGISEN
jgi:hypothetical protein